jgi:hypothetical protein
VPLLEEIANSGRCIFCGGEGLSKGHLFPNWLSQYLAIADPHTPQKRMRIDWLVDKRGEILNSRKVKYRSGGVGNLKVRAVCRNCNNGWMSVLEQNAKVIWPRLFFKRRGFLLPEGQSVLARLCALRTSLLLPKQIDEPLKKVRFRRTGLSGWGSVLTHNGC